MNDPKRKRPRRAAKTASASSRSGADADALAALMRDTSLGFDNSFWSDGGQAACALAELGDPRAACALRLLTGDRSNARQALAALEKYLETAAGVIGDVDLELLAAMRDPAQHEFDLDGTSPSGGRIDGTVVLDGARVRALAHAELERRRAAGPA